MRIFFPFILLFGLASSSAAVEPISWVKKPILERDSQSEKWLVSFELDSFCDVEVAIVEPQTGQVVRHLAAGRLGPKAPAPFEPGTRFQKLLWDGKDDHRKAVPKPKSLAVRVRAGMSVSLDRIVGGDPYAFYSEESGHNDHSPFGINGLECKPDGTVVVLGHSSNLGPPAVRQYDTHGNYLRTIFPPPAGKRHKDMAGWGIHVHPDGTYSPRFNRLTDPSLSTTILDTPNGGMARLMPTPDRDRLTFWQTGFGNANFELLTIHTDGTIPSTVQARGPGPLVKDPPLRLGPIEPNSHIVHSLLGPVFTNPSVDGKHFYLSGIFAATTRYGTIQEIASTGIWRDGQVWKVDRETRTAKVLFQLDPKTVPTALKQRQTALGGTHSYAALHAVADDADGNVFICDRLNKRIVILDSKAKIVREIPIEHADAIAVSAKSRVLYVTTRTGDEHTGRGSVALVKFSDWKKDTQPTTRIRVSATGYTDRHKCSHLVVCESDAGTTLWVAYTEMPVRIYRDSGTELSLIKDFYRVEGAQRCLGFDRMEVDQKTGDVYLLDDHSGVWSVRDWTDPRFEKLPIQTASIAIDSHNRHLYARTLADGSSSYSVGKVARFQLDTPKLLPANIGMTGTNRLTPAFHYEWCFTGNGDKGIAIAPNGNLAVVGDPKDGLRVFAGTASRVPWEATMVAKLPDAAGGVRFDLQGNLYVGFIDQKPTTRLPGFEADRFAGALGRIHKYAPTGSLESGNLFPKPPSEPARTYDVPYGAFDTDCITRTPRFGVDGYGRIYYPTNIAQRVTVIDNAGNEILRFGTYGNRDSTGGLTGDRVPVSGIPLAFPNSVDATDDHIFVADMVNLRVLRLKKVFRAEAQSQ